MKRLFNCFFVALLLMIPSACDRGGVDPASEPAPETNTEAEAEQLLKTDELSKEAQQEQAMAAIIDLRDTLMGRVMSVATEEGFGAAVEICNEEAIPLTEEIAAKYQLQIGRTSEKLRNPDNTAPAWVAELAPNAQEGPFFQQTDQSTLRGVAPIRLAAACVNCHGQPDQLASGVAEALASRYPADQATGYAEGDLRGYFWIEVPAN